MQKSIHPGEAVAERAKRYAVRLCFPGNATSRSLPIRPGENPIASSVSCRCTFPREFQSPLTYIDNLKISRSRSSHRPMINKEIRNFFSRIIFTVGFARLRSFERLFSNFVPTRRETFFLSWKMNDVSLRETMNVEATPENLVPPRGGNGKGNDGSSIGLTVGGTEGATGENTGRIANSGFREAVRAYSVESGLPGSVDRCPGRAAIYNHPCSLPPSLAPTLSLDPSPSLLRLSQSYAFRTAPPTWLPCEQLRSFFVFTFRFFFLPNSIVLL